MEEDPPIVRKFQKELNAGTVSFVLLGLLDGATEPMYGYRISKRLEEIAGGELLVKQGTLYPVLRALEGAGLLRSEIEPSVAGPPRRYYAITAEGRATFRAFRTVWTRTRDLVEAVLREAGQRPTEEQSA